MSRDLAWSLAAHADSLRADPGLAAVFLADGVPAEGDDLVQPALGRTLTAIAEAGADEFYEGRSAPGSSKGSRRST